MKTEQNKQRLFRGFRPDKKGSVTITVNGEKIRGEWEYWNELGELETISHDKELVSQGFKYGRTFDSVNREIDLINNQINIFDILGSNQ